MTKTKQSQRYRIRAADDDETTEVLIYGDIGLDFFGEGIGAQAFVDELGEIETPRIDVRINSHGGFVFDGLAIANALIRHDAEVTTHVDGLAASIASIVALAGDEVRIAENAFVMVHNAWGFVVGNASDMRELADVLDKLDTGLAETYARKTGESVEAALEWMAAETWFNARDAEELGLVDAVEEQRELAAAAGRFDLSAYRHVPREVAARFGGEASDATRLVVTPELLSRGEELVEAFLSATAGEPVSWTCTAGELTGTDTVTANGPALASADGPSPVELQELELATLRRRYESRPA